MPFYESDICIYEKVLSVGAGCMRLRHSMQMVDPMSVFTILVRGACASAILRGLVDPYLNTSEWLHNFYYWGRVPCALGAPRSRGGS